MVPAVVYVVCLDDEYEDADTRDETVSGEEGRSILANDMPGCLVPSFWYLVEEL